MGFCHTEVRRLKAQEEDAEITPRAKTVEGNDHFQASEYGERSGHKRGQVAWLAREYGVAHPLGTLRWANVMGMEVAAI